ncbi:MAG: hypothetical protein HQ505_04805 [Nitrosopumilus sp.]|nr:hypothetical protein [Nitrosopumilus sp.]
MDVEEEYRKIMIKQKKEFDEFKKKEGDSDIIFNEKDNERKNLEFVLSKTRDMPEEES